MQRVLAIPFDLAVQLSNTQPITRAEYDALAENDRTNFTPIDVDRVVIKRSAARGKLDLN